MSTGPPPPWLWPLLILPPPPSSPSRLQSHPYHLHPHHVHTLTTSHTILHRHHLQHGHHLHQHPTLYVRTTSLCPHHTIYTTDIHKMHTTTPIHIIHRLYLHLHFTTLTARTTEQSLTLAKTSFPSVLPGKSGKYPQFLRRLSSGEVSRQSYYSTV